MRHCWVECGTKQTACATHFFLRRVGKEGPLKPGCWIYIKFKDYENNMMR